MEESNPELESFRQQWREEVSSRAKKSTPTTTTTTTTQAKQPRKPAFERLASSTIPIPVEEDEEEEDHEEPQMVKHLAGTSRSGESYKDGIKRAPTSALEHYEDAVEKETQGSLGDSLDLYRKAYRMDDRVDQVYKQKHFPPSSFPSTAATKLNPSSTAARTAPKPSNLEPPQTIKALIASFSGLKIEPSPPLIENTSPPPCPMSSLPEEILVHILTDLATLDLPSFVRLAQVCKRFAYLFATEEQVWKRVCLGSEFGFGAMHYTWQLELSGSPLTECPSPPEEVEDGLNEGVEPIPTLDPESITASLLQTAYSSSYHLMYRMRPRIRFNGAYISTMNYMRPGQASPSQITWNSPVHIVTYFRYLRFYRDGTAISHLTTAPPAEVIPHLTLANLHLHRQATGVSHLPSVVMKKALRGRWRLSSLADSPNPTAILASPTALKDSEGELFVETEGANEKYTYRMQFSLRTGGRAPKNNKLIWMGFWNYNMLTDDTGEFTLRHDKPFVFSRVKSWGLGT